MNVITETAERIQVATVIDADYSIGEIVPYRPMPALQTFSFRGYTEPRSEIKRQEWQAEQEHKVQEERARVWTQYLLDVRAIEILRHPTSDGLRNAIETNAELVQICLHNRCKERHIERAGDIRLPPTMASEDCATLEFALWFEVQRANDRMRTACGKAELEYRNFVACGGLERSPQMQRKAARWTRQRADSQVAQDHLENQLAADYEPPTSFRPDKDQDGGGCTAIAIAVAHCGR